MSVLEWLNEWFKSNCNGDWEHCFKITIETLDNPGWAVSIDLSETELENVEFLSVKIYHSDSDWMICDVKNNVFYGDGDPDKLIKILETFQNWQKANDCQ